MLKKWEAQEASNAAQKQAIAGASRKRRRIADKPHNQEALSDIVELIDGSDDVDGEAENQVQGDFVGMRKSRGRRGLG